MTTVKPPFRRDHVFRYWNWKSALLSAAFRSAIFFSVNLPAGLVKAAGAAGAESGLFVLTSGFYGAFVQRMRRCEPTWLTALAVTTVFPAGVHLLELLTHRIRGTEDLKTALAASMWFSALSGLFNWYAMRRGALIAGRESQPLVSDLARLPSIAAGFVLAVPIAAWRACRKRLKRRLARRHPRFDA
jgi:hypothetical protein